MAAEELYNYLEGFDNSTNEDIFKQIVGSWTQKQMEATVDTLFSLIQPEYFTKPSFFNFYSNSTLGGGPRPCAAPWCRMANVDALARFSALYADKVLIPSPMDVHYKALIAGKPIDPFDFATSILILLKLKPLVLAHIVGFSSSYLCLCQECLKKITTQEKKLKDQLSRLHQYLLKDFVNIARCTLQRDSYGNTSIVVDGLEKYGYHEHTYTVMPVESPIIKKMLSKSKSKVIEISPSVMKKLRLADYYLSLSVEDVIRAQIMTEIVDSSYLTNRLSDCEIIDTLRLEHSEYIKSFDSKTISSSMFQKIPMISNATIDSIVKLRKSNEDSFVIYRDSINKFLKKSNNLDQKLIEELQCDLIDPEIHKMQQTIRQNRKALIKNSIRDMALCVAGVSIGVFSGVLPLDYVSTLGVIGGIPTIGKCISDLRAAFSDDVIKSNNFYFFWKLSKEQEKL